MNWLLKLIAPYFGRLLELGVAVITGGIVAYMLFRERETPDERYHKAMDTIIKRWQRDVDSFASGVANENVDKVSAHLARAERRKLLRTLQEQADSKDEAEGKDSEKG